MPLCWRGVVGWAWCDVAYWILARIRELMGIRGEHRTVDENCGRHVIWECEINRVAIS